MVDVLTLKRIEKTTIYGRKKFFLWFTDENGNAYMFKNNARTDTSNFDKLLHGEDYTVEWHATTRDGLIVDRVIIPNSDGTF